MNALVGRLDNVLAFAPGTIVIALGLDAFGRDPFGGLSVSTPWFAWMAQMLARLDLPTVIVQ